MASRLPFTRISPRLSVLYPADISGLAVHSGHCGITRKHIQATDYRLYTTTSSSIICTTRVHGPCSQASKMTSVLTGRVDDP